MLLIVNRRLDNKLDSPVDAEKKGAREGDWGVLLGIRSPRRCCDEDQTSSSHIHDRHAIGLSFSEPSR